jgi:hypothetical protein
MTRFVLCLFAVMAAQTFCHADVKKLPANDQKMLLDAARFREIQGTTNLPPGVFSRCADLKGRLAEPGQKWEPTDEITDEKLPTRRLIWAVTDGDYYVVHYERGGFAHSFRLLVARVKAGESKPSFIWRGAGGQLKDYSAFLEALRSGKVDDQMD